MPIRSAVWSLVACLVLIASNCASSRAQLASAPESETAVQQVSASHAADSTVVQALDESDAPANFVLPREQHVWARFAVGSWRETRTTTETFDEQGEVVSRSVTTQHESLLSASNDRYSLDVQATVDLVGKRITGKVINRVLQTATDGPGQIVASRRLKDADLSVADRTIPCQVWEVTYSDELRVLVDRVYYSPDIFPYVLRRETTAESSAENPNTSIRQVQTVIALEVPYSVDDKILHCTCLEATRQGEKGNSVQVSLVSRDIPGGEVAVWSTDFDTQGRRSRWNSRQLVSYGKSSSGDSQQSRREIRRSRRLSR